MAEDTVPLDDLEARISRIEARLQTSPPPESTDVTGAFWVLAELKRRESRPTVLYTGVATTAEGEPVEWQVAYDSASVVEEDWTTHAPVLAALGHPTRLRILQLIARGEAHTAADLAHAEGLGTTGQIYHHLRQLVGAGWLRTTTKGRHQIPPERLIPLLVIFGASR